MQLSLLLLELQLHLLHVFLHALHFEFIALKFALNAPFRASLVLQVLRELHEHLVLLELDGVALTAQLCSLRQQLLLLPLVRIQVTPKLPNQLPVLFVISLGLQRLILNQKLTAFFP